MGEPYLRHWTFQDLLEFHRNAFNEQEVVCQWTDYGALCNHRIKARDFRAHLQDRHGVTSDAQCQWNGCSGDSMKRSSLERHMKEQHVPFRWPCPFCELTFSREATLLDHIEERCPRRPSASVPVTQTYSA